MTKPFENKSPEMKETLERLFPKETERVRENKCPTCGTPIVMKDFKDPLSIKEYGISGMCQKCQDGFFGSDE